MVELADTYDSGSYALTGVGVRVSLSASIIKSTLSVMNTESVFFYTECLQDNKILFIIF